MTAEELLDKLLQMKESPSWERNKDSTVVVRVNNPSIGPLACSVVESVGFGFDWDTGKFLIFCQDRIIKQPKS